MKILVIGKNGQLAQALASLSTVNIEIVCLGREHIDILDKSSLLKTITENNHFQKRSTFSTIRKQ